MKKVAVIGTGQLGSRHLQGLKTAETDMEIWVVDASEMSLKIAKERYEAVENLVPRVIHYETTLDALPPHIDLVIVATGSKPRASIVKDLLNHSTVSNLILEKFLFPRLNDYDKIANLLEEKNVKCWVNCPRRMWPAYEEIKRIIDPSMPVILENVGRDWGMCCNSVHNIDLWMYLAGDCDFTVDLSEVEPRIVNSKRNGYIELFGLERFVSKNGDEMKLCSLEEYDGEAKKIIKNGNNLITINEADGIWFFNDVRHEAKTPFQSELTGVLADELFKTGNCRLSPFAVSVRYHVPYLKEVMAFVNKIQGVESDICPIT